jgi:hypothetical protein
LRLNTENSSQFYLFKSKFHKYAYVLDNQKKSKYVYTYLDFCKETVSSEINEYYPEVQ